MTSPSARRGGSALHLRSRDLQDAWIRRAAWGHGSRRIVVDVGDCAQDDRGERS